MLVHQLLKLSPSLLQTRPASTLSYVQRIKLLQAMREEDDRCGDLLKRGQYLAFLNRRPLLSRQRSSLPEPDLGAGMNTPRLDKAALMQHGSQQLHWLSHGALQSLCPADDVTARCSLLHVAEDGSPCFAAALPGGAEVAARARDVTSGEFADPRMALFLLPWQQAHTMSHAFARLNWLAITNFCPNCGAELRTRAAGHCKRCPSCETVQYPMTPPVGITMVTDSAQTRALLVRQARHPPGMYSCVAGFLEPGETVESCVRREVAEEVGLELDSVRYAASQHWPFNGSSLMVGCYAQTEGTELDLDRDELEDARWFSVEEIYAAYRRILDNPEVRIQKTNTGGLWIPPDGAIAHRLIKAWLADRGLTT